jgi:riboflavin kinase/FMN adenylyltransferase
VVEVYVLDFDGDLYGRQVGVEVVKRLRDEARYPSAAALAEQIGQDVEETRRLLA